MKKTIVFIALLLFCGACSGLDRNYDAYIRAQSDHSARAMSSIDTQVRAIKSISSTRSLMPPPNFQTPAESAMYAVMIQMKELTEMAIETLALSQVRYQPMNLKAPTTANDILATGLPSILNAGINALTLGLVYGIGNSQSQEANGNMDIGVNDNGSVFIYDSNTIGRDLTTKAIKADRESMINRDTTTTPEPEPCGPETGCSCESRAKGEC
jgi:hypothetical protein